jgi:hypothetical protein
MQYTPDYPCVDYPVCSLSLCLFRHVDNAAKHLLASLSPSVYSSVCLYTRNNSRTAGWIFIKFDIEEFYEKKNVEPSSFRTENFNNFFA